MLSCILLMADLRVDTDIQYDRSFVSSDGTKDREFHRD